MTRDDITGLVLAGGQGSRMGGVDKGLVPFHGRPLAQHALERLSPQVGTSMISANRHHDRYRAFGAPVLSDGGEAGTFDGPLAGILAGLQACQTDWLATVPCDTPGFPLDLVQRLMTGLDAAGAEIAIAATQEHGETRLQPVFCLLHRDLAPGLAAFLATGQRKSGLWSAGLRRTVVRFDDAAAFANANTAAELAGLPPPVIP